MRWGAALNGTNANARGESPRSAHTTQDQQSRSRFSLTCARAGAHTLKVQVGAAADSELRTLLKPSALSAGEGPPGPG